MTSEQLGVLFQAGVSAIEFLGHLITTIRADAVLTEEQKTARIQALHMALPEDLKQVKADALAVRLEDYQP